MTTWTCRCGQVNTSAAPCSSCLNPAPADTTAVVRRAAEQRVPSALVVSVVVLLVAGLLGAAFVRPAADEGIDPAAARRAARLEAVVPELSAFVEQARGLTFKERVDVVLLDGPDFRQRLRELQTDDVEELEATEAVLRALGLIGPTVDLKEEIDALLGAAVVGFYDPETGDLVVRGAAPTAAVRVTLVHELTHALQDQHFELDRDQLDERDDEAAQAFSGLVEGDAVRIQDAYRDSLPLDEQKEAEREQVLQSAGVGADAPAALLQILLFPYVTGPPFAAKVFEGGQDRLDAAFTDPPTTSEHLIHPDRFLAGEVPRPVDPPRAGGKSIDKGVLGELGLLLLLGNSIDSETALRAAEGWGGDRYVGWRDGARACVRTAIVTDTDDDRRELKAALDKWAKEHGDVRVVDRGPITFTACG